MPDRDLPAGADVVVVGGGTAGCVAAAELSRDTDRRVVLIEAGPAGSDPALAGVDYLAGAAPERFWHGGSVPAGTRAGELVERVAGQPPRPYGSGRGVGGSAAVNGMLAVAPTRGDVESWGLDGSPMWGWGAVAPVIGQLATGWAQTPPAALGPLERALADAAATSGIGSFGPVALERAGERRASVAERLLAPVLGRRNLTVVTGAEVTRLLLDGDRCVGVALGPGDHTVAAGEVVLAAGAIRSPLLLARCGLIEAVATGRLADHPSGTFTLHRSDGAAPAAFQTCGALRWRTASGAIAELLPIDRVGAGLGAVTLALMDPVSTGSIETGRGPIVARLGLLDADRDRLAMREAIADSLRVLGQPAVGRLVERITAGSLGVAAADLADAPDAVLDAWVAETGPLLHAGCSLPLGSALDAAGRVAGVAGLSVVDASALPVLPAAAPNATVTVVASVLARHLRS